MKALIVAAGERPPADLFLRRYGQADFSIAVDGGLAAFCAEAPPGLVIGDMDSVDDALLARFTARGVRVIAVGAEKNETDSMLAVDEAIRRGAAEIIMLGATGGRLDHMLSNLALLRRAAKKGVGMTIEDGRQSIFVGSGDFEIHGKKGETVSLLPAGGSARVSAEGLFYPLDGLLLRGDETRGVSNVLTQDMATIHAERPVFVIRNIVPV